jgi:aarF domain-containing kinase
MLQANNQLLGSPSERINITAAWAAKGYAEFAGSRALRDIGLRRWLRDRYDSALFRLTLWVIEWAFWWTSLKARFSRSTGSWEDRLQAQMERMAKEEFGIEIDGNTAFLG